MEKQELHKSLPIAEDIFCATELMNSEQVLSCLTT